jgi:hypothetical protein
MTAALAHMLSAILVAMRVLTKDFFLIEFTSLSSSSNDGLFSYQLELVRLSWFLTFILHLYQYRGVLRKYWLCGL